jgi:hypothetical protein
MDSWFYLHMEFVTFWVTEKGTCCYLVDFSLGIGKVALVGYLKNAVGLG